MRDNVIDIGIRQLRQSARLKLSDLAVAAQVHPTILKRIERGLCEIELDTAERLAAALETSTTEVIRQHRAFVARAIPGEGYTTSKKSEVIILQPRIPVSDDDPRNRVLDLFCGAGGLSYGFERAGGFVTVGGIDLLRDRIETFTANHSHAYGIAGDICEMDAGRIRQLVGRVDVIVGGPPCQGFSSIRPFRTLTEADPRNNLVERYVLMLTKLQPSWFVFENVVGLLTHEGGKKLDAIISAFSEAGYSVSWRVINVALFGVPQFRERIVIVGNRLGVSYQWPSPTHFSEFKSMAGQRAEVIRCEPLFQGILPPAVTLEEALGDLPKVASGEEVLSYDELDRPLSDFGRYIRDGANVLTWHRATKHSKQMLEIIKHAGNSIKDLPAGMVTSGFSSCYSRLSANRPSTTITVNFVHPSSNRCIHPHQDRALTYREGARLQTFPDTFIFRGTATQVAKQIGNAVPPLLGRIVATHIINSSEGLVVS